MHGRPGQVVGAHALLGHQQASLHKFVQRRARQLGSKECLYKAVLDHAFRSARFREDSFDPGLGSPLEALTRFVEDAFDTFASRPDFVRLLTMENLSGAVHIKNSLLISRLNQRGFKHIESIVRRRKGDGTMRSDITPLDVYINLVGMCYYHAANRTGYLASFKGRLNEKIASEAFHASRKRAVIKSVTRYALVQI